MGPYETITEIGKGRDGSYTVIRPRALGANGILHAPITFGPGTGMQVSQMSNFLQRSASHGFVVIGRPHRRPRRRGDASAFDCRFGVDPWLAPSYAASQTQTFFGMLTGADHGYTQGTVNGVQGGNEIMPTYPGSVTGCTTIRERRITSTGMIA